MTKKQDTITFDREKSRLSDGREAIVVDGPARGVMTVPTNNSSPNPGTLVERNVESNDIWQLLTEDEKTLYACKRGDYVSESMKRTLSHTAHHNNTNPPGPRYPEETIKTVLRIYKQLKHDGAQRPYVETAAELNKLGIDVNSPRGRNRVERRWTEGAVHHIVTAYAKKYRVHIRRNGGEEPVNADVVAATTEMVEMINVPFPDGPGPRLAAIYESMKIVLADIETYGQRVRERVADMELLMRAAVSTRSPEISEEELETLREKAARWDQAFSLFGSKSSS